MRTEFRFGGGIGLRLLVSLGVVENMALSARPNFSSAKYTVHIKHVFCR